MLTVSEGDGIKPSACVEQGVTVSLLQPHACFILEFPNK